MKVLFLPVFLYVTALAVGLALYLIICPCAPISIGG